MAAPMHTLQLLAERSYVLHALVASVAIGVVCSLLSVLVVLKRMAFIGQGISHAGFGGIGTAALLGLTGAAFRWEQDLVVLLFCVGTAVLIGYLSRSKRVESDTAIGVLLAATMAWGVLAQNLRVELQTTEAYRQWVGTVEYSPPWETILFGSLLNVGSQGMWTAVALAALIVLVCAGLFKELQFYAFDETVSRVFGVPATAMHYLLLLVLSLVIVVSIRLVGLILVNAILVMPGATALLVSRRLGTVLWTAAVVGVIGTTGGLVMSLEVGTLAPGACIVAILSVLFVAAYGYSRVRRASAT
jgi:ABC-type Mn2+/Zn2+ transport system permease subunit